MTTTIRRYVETDTGHRVPNHKSKCKHLHGHRYRFEAEIEGDVVEVSGVSDEGMLMDFSDISKVLMEHVHDVEMSGKNSIDANPHVRWHSVSFLM